jgi:hypothetical protein
MHHMMLHRFASYHIIHQIISYIISYHTSHHTSKPKAHPATTPGSLTLQERPARPCCWVRHAPCYMSAHCWDPVHCPSAPCTDDVTSDHHNFLPCLQHSAAHSEHTRQPHTQQLIAQSTPHRTKRSTSQHIAQSSSHKAHTQQLIESAPAGSSHRPPPPPAAPCTPCLTCSCATG